MTGYFSEVARQWDEMRKGFFSNALREKACEAARVQPGRVAADVGAGTGFLTEELLARGLRVIAVDPEDAMLAEIRRKLGASSHLELRTGGAEALPLADGESDYAFANMVLHHVEDPPAAIREMVRVLGPGGRLVITDLDQHDHEFLRKEHHDRWMGFRRADLHRWLAAAGLDDIRVLDAEETCSAASDCGSDRARISIFVATGERPSREGS